MRRLLWATSCLTILLTSLSAYSREPRWVMVWHDEFEASTVDSSKWSVIPRGASNWNRYMSPRADLIEIKEGNVLMHGIANPDTTTDKVPYLTGGLYSKGKFSFCYGKIEIRARLGSVQGAWPAFWMLPAGGNQWPAGGEIDIMEHLNFDNFVYQTIHSHYTLKLGLKDTPKNFGTAPIDREGYNVYGLEWNDAELIFSINGKQTFRYPKIATDREGQWPFDTPFYILIDQQLGGKDTWPGEVQNDQLPATMWVDYVRVYQSNH